MPKRIPESLLALPMLKGLERGDIERLAAGAAVLAGERGTIMFREGDTCTGLYFVLKGLVKLSLQTDKGQERILQLVDEGESFGEVALFLRQRHLMTAQALVDSALLHVTREAVSLAVHRSPEFAYRVVRELSRQLLERTLDLQSCMLLSGSQRVVRYLLSRIPESANGGGAEVLLPARKGIIASKLNLTQEHFSRILRELVSEALIEVVGRTVRIPDVHRLRSHGVR